MSISGCEFTINQDKPETWGGKDGDDCDILPERFDENGCWECPHDPEPGESLCIFHRPIEQKDEEAVVDSFLTAVNQSPQESEADAGSEPAQFLGAEFGAFVVEEKVDSPAVAFDCSYATVHANLDWQAVEVPDSQFIGLRVAGDTSFDDATFTGAANFKSATFSGDAHFKKTRFQRRAMFARTHFNGEANFTRAEVTGPGVFSGSTFDTDSQFDRAKFKGEAYFPGATFNGDLTFRLAKFRQDVNFRKTAFQGSADLQSVTFGGDANFETCRFEYGPAYAKSTFHGAARFSTTEFAKGADFDGVEFRSLIDFRQARLPAAYLKKLDLTEADFTGADLRNSDLESALLSRATLFGADLRGVQLSGAVMGDVRVDHETQFLSRGSGRTRLLSPMTTAPCCVYDPDYEDGDSGITGTASEATSFDGLRRSSIGYPDGGKDGSAENKAKSVYRALEEVGRNGARPRLQAQSFVRRQELQKRAYWTTATHSSETSKSRIVALSRWVRAKTAEVVILYGESPWRVIAYSLGVILAFGIIFPLGGWLRTTGADGGTTVTYSQIMQDPILFWKSVFHSTMLFASGNSYGGVEAANVGGELLTTTVALLGPTLLALLVFVLGRRAAR